MSRHGPRTTLAALAVFAAALAGCSHTPPLNTVASVDLDRYAGDWFVIAHLPARNERDAYDAVEHYEFVGDDRVDIHYRFRRGAHDGELRTIHMRGRVRDAGGGARWWVRPFWPLRVDYDIIHLESDYSAVVVGHPSRDYAWIMARAPSLSADVYARAVESLRAQGFDVGALRVVPQDQ